MSSKKAPDLPRQVMALLFEFMMAQKKRFQAAAVGAGLQPPQVGMMLNLRDKPEGLPMHQLAEECGCDPSNITGMVDKLEEKELVRRESSPTDRRVKIIVLTESGKRLLGEVMERMQDPPDWVLKLSTADQKALRDLLDRGLHSA